MHRIVHIHSDFKFISEISKYKGEEFHNVLIILGEKNEKNLKYHQSAIFLIPNNDNLPVIINYCKNADLVVLNDLDSYKRKIVSILPKEITTAWRFFGYELYARRTKYVLSEKTKEIINQRHRINLLKNFINEIVNIRSKFLLSSAMKRIDFFFCMYYTEYKNLKSLWKRLPPYINILVYKEKIEKRIYRKENFYILGNNRSAYNNHLDIIDLILHNNSITKIKGKLFFNYGEVTRYSEAIKKVINNHPDYFELLEEFLTIEEFENIYKKASAFVLNSYRQMALSNIFTALKYGVKIYLNSRNDAYDWLRDNHFIIYTIEEFESDYIHTNLKLEETNALHNMELLNKLFERNNPQVFQRELKTLLNNRNPSH